MGVKKPVKILLVATTNMNLGDTVIADNNRYLIERIMKALRRPCEVFCYNIASRDLAQIAYCDAVAFAGGILKVTNEKFFVYIPEILRMANSCGVPAFLNGISVEQYYADNPASQELRDALNLPCVKGISVRDDMETLKRDYITNSNIVVRSVYDAAIWTRKTYEDILSPTAIRDNAVIGLGITRDKLFPDYGNPQIDKAFLLDFWKDLTARLEADGYRWVLFTNGDTYDERFCREVLEYIGHGEKLPAPYDGGDLVKMISRFRCVIGPRMHSNIIAYALGIPSVGFIWNQKLRFWGKKIGFPERFIEPGEMTTEKVYRVFLGAISDNRKTGPSWFKCRAMERALRKFLSKYAVSRRKVLAEDDSDSTNTADNQSIPIERMMASHLGALHVRYSYTNSLEAFRYSLSEGYRNFELSLRLSSDGVLLCVRSFEKELFHTLGMARSEDENKKPVSSTAFLGSKYYNRFPTMTFEEFRQELSRTKLPEGFTLLLYIGKPGIKNLLRILEQLMPLFSDPRLAGENLILRLETHEAVEQVKALNLNVQLAYHFTTDETDSEQQIKRLIDTIRYCKEQGVDFLTMAGSRWNPETARVCADANMKVIPCSYKKLGDTIQALKLGAAYVGNHYYTVNYAKNLIE